MKFTDLARWNTRVSAVYALGVWTMIGSFAFFHYTGRYDLDKTKKVEKKQEIEEINVVVHETAHNKTVITYKKDFVPYPTRIYNFFQSFSSGPGGGASDK